MRKTVVIISVLIAGLLGMSGIFDNHAMYGLIHADAQGYYGYLIAIFIEGSFDWQQVIQPYADAYFDGNAADFTVQSEFGRINKYYVGTAVMILPFFLLSCVAAWFFGFPVDGYSAPFQHGVMIGALFYAGVGMYFLSKLLEAKGISKSLALTVSVLVLFATNLFHYCISEPAMSHAYSFGLVCVFLFKVNEWLQGTGWRDLLWAAVTFGLIVLIRPVNGLVLFSVPFLAGGLMPLWAKLTGMKKVWPQLGIGILLVLGVLVIQSLMYVAQVDKLLVWSYQDEGFNFLNPKVFSVLFSYKKGFFVYTPIAFLGGLGLILLLFRKPKEGVWIWFFLGLAVYVISSWWNWYYGGSFGHRAMIEFLPFFAIGLAFLFQESGKPLRVVVLSVCVLFVGVNLIQSYQYQKFILHWVGMDKARYWEVFLKTDKTYDGIFYKRDRILETRTFKTDFEPGTRWSESSLDTTVAFSGYRSSRIGPDQEFGATLGIPATEMGPQGRKEITISGVIKADTIFDELTMAFSFRGDSGDYGHTYVPLSSWLTRANVWHHFSETIEMPLARGNTDAWIVYPHGHPKQNVYVDDIIIEVVTLKD